MVCLILCCFKLLCLVDLMLKHYVLWQMAIDFLSLEQNT